MTKLVLIAVGGGAGSVLRYLVSGWCQRLAGSGFPLGTLTVNVTGCFLIGLLMAVFTGPALIREEYRLALVVGVLGGFTTFSAFGWETFAMLNDRQFLRPLLNVAASNAFGLVAVWLGYRVAERYLGA